MRLIQSFLDAEQFWTSIKHVLYWTAFTDVVYSQFVLRNLQKHKTQLVIVRFSSITDSNHDQDQRKTLIEYDKTWVLNVFATCSLSTSRCSQLRPFSHHLSVCSLVLLSLPLFFTYTVFFFFFFVPCGQWFRRNLDANDMYQANKELQHFLRAPFFSPQPFREKHTALATLQFYCLLNLLLKKKLLYSLFNNSHWADA